MTKTQRILGWMLHPVSLIFFIALLVFSYVYVDKALAIYFHQLDLRQKFYFLSLISLLGKSEIYLVVLFLMAASGEYFKIDRLWRNRFWFLFLCVLVPNAICLVLKIGLGRARPDLYFESQLYGFYWFKFHKNYWSFPSGHTTTVVSMLAGLSLIWPRYLLVYLLFGLMVVATRVLLYHHYLSDVLFAFYLTLITLGLMKCWLENKKLLTT